MRCGFFQGRDAEAHGCWAKDRFFDDHRAVSHPPLARKGLVVVVVCGVVFCYKTDNVSSFDKSAKEDRDHLTDLRVDTSEQRCTLYA